MAGKFEKGDAVRLKPNHIIRHEGVTWRESDLFVVHALNAHNVTLRSIRENAFVYISPISFNAYFDRGEF